MLTISYIKILSNINFGINRSNITIIISYELWIFPNLKLNLSSFNFLIYKTYLIMDKLIF